MIPFATKESAIRIATGLAKNNLESTKFARKHPKAAKSPNPARWPVVNVPETIIQPPVLLTTLMIQMTPAKTMILFALKERASRTATGLAKKLPESKNFAPSNPKVSKFRKHVQRRVELALLQLAHQLARKLQTIRLHL